MTPKEIIAIVAVIIGLLSILIFFTILFNNIAKSQIEDIRLGKLDDEIYEDEKYERLESTQKKNKKKNVVKTIGFYAVLIIVVPSIIFSLINKIQNNITIIGDKTIMVVASGSMSEKHEVNNYLIQNQLNNQFQTYDIIILEKINSSEELKQYDVIAYVNDEKLNVIHRIIDIENGTYETRGDANDASDKYHPTYSDVIGRYTGTRVPYIGMFIIFFQSYYGIITILSLLYCIILFDKINSQINDAKKTRLNGINLIVDYSSDEEIIRVNDKIITYNGNTYRTNDRGQIEKIKIENKEVIVEEIVYNPSDVTDDN